MNWTLDDYHAYCGRPGTDVRLLEDVRLLGGVSIYDGEDFLLRIWHDDRRYRHRMAIPVDENVTQSNRGSVRESVMLGINRDSLGFFRYPQGLVPVPLDLQLYGVGDLLSDSQLCLGVDLVEVVRLIDYWPPKGRGHLSPWSWEDTVARELAAQGL